jgi:hypothetical protein
MSLDSLGKFYTRLSEDPTLMEKLKQKYRELLKQPNRNPWYTEEQFFEALKILGKENNYNFTIDEVEKVIGVLGASWSSGRAVADGDGPPFISCFDKGHLNFANAESLLKQWIKFTNENRQKYIQLARTEELTPEQEKILLFCFFDNPYYYPPEKAAHQMNISVEEYDKVKNELYERFGTRERQARPNSVTNLDAILDSQLKEETGIINPWNRIWESLE